MKSFCWLVALLLGIPFSLSAQNLAPNPSFEIPAANGTNPVSWLPVGTGVWEDVAYTGAKSVSLAGAPNGSRQWYPTATIPVQQAQGYLVRFRARSTNMTQGFLVIGFDNAARRDFLNRPGNAWVEYSYVAWIPNQNPFGFRLGSYDANGKLFFDDVEVLPLNPVHTRAGSLRLGTGENVTNGQYQFRSDYAGFGGNYARPQQAANTWFNGYRWYLDPGKQVTYRHELAGQAFTNAQITYGIQNYNNITSTSLWVEVSSNGTTWLPAGGLQGTNVGTLSVPPELFPATNLWVRLGTLASAQFALTNYIFSAATPGLSTNVTGETHHWGQWMTPSNAQITDTFNTATGKVATVSIVNAALTNQTFQVTARAEFSGTVRERMLTAVVLPGATNSVDILLPTAGFGDNIVHLQIRDGGGVLRLHESLRHTVSILADDSYGETLPGSPDCEAWWCAGAYKVGATRAVPLATGAVARVSAARNEYEPFQIVLRPVAALTNVSVGIGDFTGLTNGATIAATNVTICRGEFVNVSTVLASEPFSVVGPHVDPLVPITGPFSAASGTNCPLWFTVRVPKDAPGGEYEATVTITHEGGGFTVPVRLRVFDFALTDVTHTRTAYGAILPYAWHGLTGSYTPAQEQAIWELYMQNMARHRISPFFPQWYFPLVWNYNSANQTFTHDFSVFDVAMERFLEEYNFNTFKDINYERELPPIGGIPRFNASSNAINSAYRPLYNKLMQPVAQHLRQRGWLDRAYSFWLDEPKANQYALTRDGMLMVEEMAPDLGRFQSEFGGPTPSLNATIWLPQWPYIDLVEGAKRQAAGEQLWFYFATNPKAPAPNNFIDHPAINARVRSWYGEKFDYDGEAYYGINYYLGTPNPWTEAMSSTDLNTPPVFYWGNGDGTLVYPPTKEKPTSPLIAGPIDSIRWEMIRDGMEDREYFWELERVLSGAAVTLGTNHPAVIEGFAAKADAMAMLPMPTAYPYLPEQLLAARTRVAEAIEALGDGLPFIAKQPLSKVVKAGDSERLRVEAVGWPVPTIQWQREGTNLPGALGYKLSLTNITPEMEGDYRVIASNSSGSVTSAVGRLTVLVTNQLPVVIKPPESLVRTNGARAVFGCGVSSLTPLTYQWLYNSATVPGATNITLLVTNVGPAHAGLYSVVAANAYGSVTSAPALLSISSTNGLLPPQITSQPTGQSLASGQTTQLSVTATGSAPLSYQWSVNWTNVTPGGSSNVLMLPNVQSSQAGDYRVVVANGVGSVTSVVATLTVQDLSPFIGSQPTNLIVVQGQTAQFNATAGGSLPLVYQWFFNTTGSVAGASSGVLTLTNVQPSQAGAYSLLVTNLFGAVTSSPALLQIAGMPAYSNQPPALSLLLQAADWYLSLPPDNRPRTVLISSNLVEWETYSSVGPSAAFEYVPIYTTNLPGRFFRVQVTP